MQNFYFSPIMFLVILLSISFVTIILLLYFIFNKSIPAIHSFNINQDLFSISKILLNNNKYPSWWPKFNKLFFYKTSVYQTSDDNLQVARIVITIQSNYSKELWEVLLRQTSSNVTNVTVYQDLKLLSKLSRILKSSFLYKRDLLVFKKSLQNKLSA